MGAGVVGVMGLGVGKQLSADVKWLECRQMAARKSE